MENDNNTNEPKLEIVPPMEGQEPKKPEDLWHEKKMYKLSLVKKVKELSKTEWLLTQEILQEIQASLIVNDPSGKLPHPTKMLDFLKEEIKTRYEDDVEIKELLLESLPTVQRFRQWFKVDGWDDAVYSKLRTGKLFSKEKRAAVIEALYRSALDGKESAAKIWLTLSGDYSDKLDVNTDRKLEAYREINEILHKKKID